ncbi:hypothetical protein AVEN_101147-1 [Araneus ventricosus]|uniref:Uncharacterized protein n=1 Tax=Araneus ventricosus TaxID=182803 RepID=A0A4Y2DG19_ARAVE|nr:hypothetical protein AVEN_101147-1 [Araneus ventricosus]
MRKKILMGCLSLLGIFEMCFSEEGGAAFLECLNEEVCQAEYGLDRGVYCAEQSPEKDLQVTFEIMSDYYPGTTELKSLFEKICANFERGVEAITYWFEEKRYRNLTYTAEQAQEVVNSRACFFLMVTECELKKALGFFG